MSLYGVPSSHTSINEWNQLLKSTKDFKDCFIGDFNAHHFAWGSNKTCNTGENFIDALTDYDLSIVNDGSHTYYSLKTDQTNNSNNPTITTSAIDLSIISTIPNGRFFRTEWKVITPQS